MTTDNTKFDDMLKQAGSHIDETITKKPEKQERENPYMLTQALLDDGFIFDLNGVYVPFKEEFQRAGVEDDNVKFETRDDIYLFISRNPDKKLELNFKWAQKTADGFKLARGFNIDFLLDVGDEKDIKTLNKKVSFSGGKNKNPASKNTYVEFVEHFTDLISETTCLEVFKEKEYMFPEIIDEETSEDVEHDTSPQCFADYPEKVQHEALNILNNGSLFNETQESVSLTHYGHETTRNALILMESSIFVDDGAHGLLGGKTGGGKTDLALTCALNLPAKNVHIISSNSPKDIFYDFESYDDEYNIIIFDDVVLNDELIKLIKLLSDNRVKKKVHKTVINGKAERFELKGKYEIIITYAKELPDEELANRLFNIGVNIVDKGESKGNVKYKIRDNKIINADNNILLQDIREPIRAGVQYLLEHKTPVFNPYLSTYNPLNFNNRDINHLVSMTNARTFFDMHKREQIRLDDETVLTIGSFDDLKFVHDIWARDKEAQKYKLSELQKDCLDILPELTDKEAFDYVDELNEKLTAQSRAYRKQVLDDEPLLKSLSKKLNVNPSTLKHALDRFNEGNTKSLCEIGLVDKIQLDESNPKSPNFYYKIKKDGATPKLSESNVQDMQIEFAHAFDSSIVKQKIIIDLLIYAKKVINERGMYALENYCKDEHVELNAESYNSMTNFLQGFFDMLNDDKHVIKYDDATRDDKLQMFKFKAKLNTSLRKKEGAPLPAHDNEFAHTTKNNETAQNTKQDNVECANQNCTSLHMFKSNIKEQLEEKNIDVEIAQQTFNCLWSNGAQTQQDITNYILETADPDDFNNENTPLKIEVHVNKMYMHDLLDYIGNKYELAPDFVDLVTSAEAHTC